MRKAARKQKKLEKLKNAANIPTDETQPIIDSINSINSNHFVLPDEPQFIADSVTEQDYAGLAQALAYTQTLKTLIWHVHDIKLLDFIKEGLKVNTSVQSVEIEFYSTDHSDRVMTCFGEILQDNNTITECHLITKVLRCPQPESGLESFFS